MAELITFGPVEAAVREQIDRCRMVEADTPAVLCADNHLGYSMPIGGVVAYRDYISPSAVGYDIACGNAAARTNVRASDINCAEVMDEIARVISFGVGRVNAEPVDSPVIEAIGKSDVPVVRELQSLAAAQLGTVGSGNHYVDLFRDEDGWVWVGVHFGSRGFGHKTATWALREAGGRDDMHAPPTVIGLGTPLADAYIEGMKLAGRYAYAGRDWVVNRVLRILGAKATDYVHNHHNFAWPEWHSGVEYWVHRKGATPAWPGERGFVGASMGEPAVILEGVDSARSVEALYSTVHGAGRVMSRTKAAGKFKGWGAKRKQVAPGVVDFSAWQAKLEAQGIELRGAGADETPECYKRLSDVLAYHGDTVRVLHTLTPIGVVMAGAEIVDPYKD